MEYIMTGCRDYIHKNIVAGKEKYKMENVSLSTQKKLLFIPLVSTAIMFIWFFINLRNSKELSYQKESFKSFLFMCCTFVIMIPFAGLYQYVKIQWPGFIHNYELIVYYVLSTVAMGLLIIYQKKKGFK